MPQGGFIPQQRYATTDSLAGERKRFRLPFHRSLQFKHETIDTEVFQPVAVVNYPSEQTPYTRITEYKYLTGQVARKTSITYEIPSAEGDPYYPIPKPENADLYKQYQTLANETDSVHFVGRLATYKYYNMDQIVAQSLTTYGKMMSVKRAQALAMTPDRSGNGNGKLSNETLLHQELTLTGERGNVHGEVRSAV